MADLLSNNYTSKSRNKLIAKAFKEIGMIERYGSGIKRNLNICFDYGVVSPTFELLHKGFKVVLFKEKLKNDTLNERQKEILKKIEKNKKITVEQIAIEYKVTELTIKRDLKKLQDLKKIQRIGSKKTGYWQIIK